MSIISELVDKLKKYAAEYDLPPFGKEIEGTKELLNQAADTIEALSEKLQAANMDNGGGWIACGDRLPEGKGWYLIYAKNQRPFVAYFKGKTFPLNNHYHEIVAWMPLPEPYRP